MALVCSRHQTLNFAKILPTTLDFTHHGAHNSATESCAGCNEFCRRGTVDRKSEFCLECKVDRHVVA